MLVAGVIACYGVIDENVILIVGAMAVAPDLLPITAIGVGLVGKGSNRCSGGSGARGSTPSPPRQRAAAPHRRVNAMIDQRGVRLAGLNTTPKRSALARAGRSTIALGMVAVYVSVSAGARFGRSRSGRRHLPGSRHRRP
jgi:hypothetical protein